MPCTLTSQLNPQLSHGQSTSRWHRSPGCKPGVRLIEFESGQLRLERLPVQCGSFLQRNSHVGSHDGYREPYFQRCVSGGFVWSSADRHGRLKAEAVSPRKPRGETVYPTCVSARGDTKRASERGVESSRELATESQRAKRCCDVVPVTGTAGAQSAVEDRVRKGDWDVPFRITRSKTHLIVPLLGNDEPKASLTQSG